MNQHAVRSFADQGGRRATGKQQTRQRLLSAARRLIVDRGYEAATIRDIAAAAEFSTGAVFASFSDKADLFNAVIVADSEALADRMADVDADGPTAEVLLEILSLRYADLPDEVALARAAMGFSWLRDSGHEARHARVRLRILLLLTEVLRRGVLRGEVTEGLDLALASEVLLDCCLSNLRKAVFEGVDREALRERLAGQIALVLANRREG